ncbi:hypothetical protein D3C72_2458720 [compost metagenome]
MRYRWRDNASDERVHYGLLAQEGLATAQAHGAPNFGGHVLVDDGDADSQQALRYSSFIAPLVAAVQVLAERVKKLESGL